MTQPLAEGKPIDTSVLCTVLGFVHVKGGENPLTVIIDSTAMYDGVRFFSMVLGIKGCKKYYFRCHWLECDRLLEGNILWLWWIIDELYKIIVVIPGCRRLYYNLVITLENPPTVYITIRQNNWISWDPHINVVGCSLSASEPFSSTSLLGSTQGSTTSATSMLL